MIMMRNLLIFLLPALFLSTHGAFAQTPLMVRAGEHTNYARLVVPLRPDSEWEIISQGRQTTFSLEGWGGGFDTSMVFDRLSRARVLSLRSFLVSGTSSLELSLACDCEVSADQTSGYVIIDIKDPIEKRAPDTGEDSAPEEDLYDPSRHGDNQIAATGLLSAPSDISSHLTNQLLSAEAQGLILRAPPKVSLSLPVEEDESPEATRALPAFGKDDRERMDIDGLASLNSSFEGIDSGSPDETSLRVVNPIVGVQTIQRGPSDLPPERVVVDPEKALPCFSEDQANFTSVVAGDDLNKELVTLRNDLLDNTGEVNEVGLNRLVRFYVAIGFNEEARSLIRAYRPRVRALDFLSALLNAGQGKPVPVDVFAHRRPCSSQANMWKLYLISKEPTVVMTNEAVAAFAQLPPVSRSVFGVGLVDKLLRYQKIDAAKGIVEIFRRAPEREKDIEDMLNIMIASFEGRTEAVSAVIADRAFAKSPHFGPALERFLESDPDLSQEAVLRGDVETEMFANRNNAESASLIEIGYSSIVTKDNFIDTVAQIAKRVQDADDVLFERFDLIEQIFHQNSPETVGDLAYARAVYDNKDLLRSGRFSTQSISEINGHVRAMGLAGIEPPRPATGPIDPALSEKEEVSALLVRQGARRSEAAFVQGNWEQAGSSERYKLLSEYMLQNREGGAPIDAQTPIYEELFDIISRER